MKSCVCVCVCMTPNDVCQKALDFRDGDFKQPSKMMFFYRIHLLPGGLIFRDLEMFVSGRVPKPTVARHTF